MAINFYAGIIKNVNGEEVVDTFLPVNIVKPIGDSSWNNGKAYSYSRSTATKHPNWTLCKVKFFDETPVNLINVLNTLYNIDSTWTKTEYENLFNKANEISFFADESVSSKLNFTLFLNSSSYDNSSGNIIGGFQLGDQKRGILWQWQTNLSEPNKKLYLVMGEEYNDTTFDSLLNSSREKEKICFENNIYDNYMNYPQYILFAPFHGIEELSFGSYNNGQEYINNCGVNLSHWANWYTMLTGKYYYGNPFVIDLKNETNGFDKIELGVPICLNDVLTEGLTTPNKDVSYGDYVGFTYYNVGTDLDRLFNSNSGVKNIALTTGYITKEVNGSRCIITLHVGEKGIKVKNYSTKYDLHYNDAGTRREYFGTYLFVHKDYATLPIRAWLEKIDNNYSAYEYGNCPLFFASYSTSDWKVIKYDYFNYDKYPQSRNPGLVSNIFVDNEWATYVDKSYEIDYSFWETFLTGITPSPVGPNIGGGSIGGGSSSEGGGSGSFDDTSITIQQPTSPSGVSGTSGLFSMYAIGTATLNKIGDWLVESWTDEKKSDTINSKLQSIISFKQVCAPGTPNLGAVTQIKAFDENITGAFGDVITSQYKTFNMGSYTFNEYFGSFLDYAPHTKISLYLPFVGIVSLDTNAVMGGKITLSCGVDWISGNITYNLSLEKDSVNSVLNTWSGNSASDIPLSQLDYSNKIAAEKSANISLLTMLGTTAAAGVALGLAPSTGGMSITGGLALAGAVGGAGMNAYKQISNYQMTEGQAASSLGGGGSVGFMNVKTPYLIIDRPISSLPEDYGHINGYMSNITKTIGYLSGYTEISECNLNNFSNATDKEVNEIMSLLKSGVIL